MSATRFDLDGGAVGFVESSPVLPLVTIVASWKHGGTSDPEGKDGLARFTARMLRRGAQGLSAEEIESTIDRLGAELGLECGPSTTTLHGQVIKRNLEPFVDLIARLIGTPVFDETELARLRRESVAELVDMRDSDRALANVALRRALFAGHPYARGASGRTSTIETFTRDDVASEYDKSFVRGSFVVGFAGALSEDEARRAGEKLAAATRPGGRGDRTIPEPPRPSGRRLVFVDKPERSQTQILIGTLGTHPRDPDHFPLVAATAVLGGTFTSRLMREIRSKRGWSYGTSARLSVERRRHAFTMSAAPGKNDCAPCIELEIDMLGEFVEKGITQRELSFIKNYLVRSHAFEIDTASKRLGQALEIELLELPADYHEGYLGHVKKVEVDAANGAVRERLSPKDFVVVVVGTADEILDKVKAAIPELAGHEVVPFDRD